MKDSIDKNIITTKDILVEYEKTTELESVLNLYKRLTLYSVFLWENLSNLKAKYNTSYYTRKIEMSKSYLNNKKRKITDRQSLEMATEENEELYKQESEFESLTIRLEIFLRQVNKVIEAMRTDISYLKQEKNRTNSNDLI